MTIPLRISARVIERTDDVQNLMRARVDKLERLSDRILNCRAVLAENRGEFVVHVMLSMPAREIAVTRRHGASLREAAHAAFDAAEQQLASHVRRLRDEGRRRARTARRVPV